MCAAALGVAATALFAQTPPSQKPASQTPPSQTPPAQPQPPDMPTPRFRTAADVVVVEATVLDRKGVVVTAATAIDPQGAWLPPASLGTPAPVNIPFCRVEGVIEQRIGFELWLPPSARWNGRLLGAGVGGDAGVFNFRDLARGVAAGYASSTTDGGHKNTEKAWMMRRDAVFDYTHRAQPLTNRAVRMLVEKYYGAAPHHAYFLGCSGGGRQGLKEAQRFASDYDGIVSGAGGPRMPEMSVRHLWHALYQQGHPEGALDSAAWARVSAAAARRSSLNTPVTPRTTTSIGPVTG